MSSDSQYIVEVTSEAQKRYIKKLEKRHKNYWSVTFKALKEAIKRVESLLQTDKAEILKAVDGHRIVKVYFTIAGSKQSAKASGHRCIVHLDARTRIASILLVYSKKELSSPNETNKIRSQIKALYPQIVTLFNWK